MSFYRDTWIEINLNAIESNIVNLQKYYCKDKKLIAVVKADAYGHGAVEVAKIAIANGVEMLAVATLDEAIELRNNYIKEPILVLGSIRVSDVNLAIRYNITITVHSLDFLKKLRNLRRKLKVHLKIETGMNRIGVISYEDIKEILNILNENKRIFLQGIYTHMATADDEDDTFFQQQVNQFRKYLEYFKEYNLIIHIGNSATTLKYNIDFTNAVRVGLTIYGLLPNKDMNLEFEPKQALKLYTKLIQVKRIQPNESVGYGRKYISTKGDWIGTIPIGYADGWDRRLANAKVTIENKPCDIVGNICMDMCMVKLPNYFKEGTLVELIGEHQNVDDFARRLRTINYQAVCILSDRLPRVYFYDNKIVRKVNRRIKKLS